MFELVLQLLVALGHEEQLHGKRVALGVIVKKGQKGVVGELFQDEAAAVVAGDQLAQGGFAGSDIAFYDDELMGQRVFHGAAF